MHTLASSNKIEIRDILQKLFDVKTEKLFDESSGKINLEHLWHTPERTKASAQLIEKFLQKDDLLKNCTSILVADTLKSQFSLFPQASILACNEKKILLIWKERAEYLRGKSVLFGHFCRQQEKVLILQDVNLGGYTIMKIIEDLNRIQRNHEHRVVGINIAILVNLANEEQMDYMIKLINKKTDFPFNITRKNFICFTEKISGLWNATYR